MKLLTLILFLYVNLVNCNYDEDLSHIKPSTSEQVQKSAAEGVVRRLIGEEKANLFKIQINFTLPQNYFKILKTNDSESVEIEASSGLAACKGFHYYLKQFCKCHLSWDGNQLENLEHELPLASVEMKASSKIIYYQNVCTHSYSFTWFTWNDWRKQIDWIALSGITLTLAPFQEDIWTEIYKEYGLSEAEIDEDLAGPGFFAWQRMGNMRGWGGPLRKNFIKHASELQHQMIKALNELGISVALPAFDGHLPVQFKQLFPNATLTAVEPWNKFKSKFCCPLFLDPIDPLFQEIGQKFLSKLTQKYGTNHIYFSDPFNEVQPRQADANYLANVSHGIYTAMKGVDTKAVWLLQGWMFVKNPFWGANLMEAFLTAVPQGKILVLDLQSEQHPQYYRTKSFYGQPFIWCMLHNFGGTLGMHGSIRLVNSEIARASNMTNSTMIGVGITPEGIHQNYVVYEFALEKAWNFKEINHKKWIKYYSNVRYGFKSDEIEHAWLMLLKSVYKFEGLQNMRGKYTLCRRPSLRLKPWEWYDEKLVKKALFRFLNVAVYETYQMNSLFNHDLVDICRQFMQNQADSLYLDVVNSYKKKDLKNFDMYSEMFLELLMDLDKLLGTHEHFLLGKFLESAKNLATNDEEEKQYEFNARNQITLWGPEGEIIDYATKQWQGIVADYYVPRWRLFFQQLHCALEQNIGFNQSQFQKLVYEKVELPFNNDVKMYQIMPQGNALAESKYLYEKWVNRTFN